MPLKSLLILERGVRETDTHIDLFNSVMHSLVASCMCPNLRPWHMGMMLQPTELTDQGCECPLYLCVLLTFLFQGFFCFVLRILQVRLNYLIKSSYSGRSLLIHFFDRLLLSTC